MEGCCEKRSDLKGETRQFQAAQDQSEMICGFLEQQFIQDSDTFNGLAF